ncbi:E3 ubiquitin-protein ligase bre1 [Parelaphostrongylus tenuis]|uniref:E3 ubiquitin protein ligase n=1 Tax=Parelaphostrongylus tenuis TaxID=148309 RepID=A0AAD5N052_PARTN|nr:E3 ubiquitin-protein ligase bre1 [Parelaphostrongylus tenuis]
MEDDRGAVEKSCDDSIIYMDANRLFSQKDAEIERLKREVAMLKDTEASLMLDLDNTGSALEELQEQNAKLISLQKENDEGHIKMMNDRIIATQLQVKIKEEMAHLESQVGNLTRQIAALQCEKESQNEALKLALETIVVKTKENGLLFCTDVQNRLIETLRKQLTEQSLNTADLAARGEKIGAQLRDIQEVVASKTLQLEVIDQRKRRLEEENSTLRKRLERAKKSEKLGSTDAVLMEEIRELKDVLTCPSCKGNYTRSAISWNRRVRGWLFYLTCTDVPPYVQSVVFCFHLISEGDVLARGAYLPIWLPVLEVLLERRMHLSISKALVRPVTK